MANVSLEKLDQNVIGLRYIPDGKRGDPYDGVMTLLLNSEYVEAVMVCSFTKQRKRIFQQISDTKKVFRFISNTYKVPILVRRKGNRGAPPGFKHLTRDWYEFICN